MMARMGLTLAAVILFGASPSYAQSDAEVCAFLAERLRAMTMSATDLEDAAMEAVPGAGDPEQVGSQRAMAAALPESVQLPMEEWVIATSALSQSLRNYASTANDAILALDRCAGKP